MPARNPSRAPTGQAGATGGARRPPLADGAISFIVVARHSGMSYARIASLMNRIGLPAQRGGTWHGSTVARVALRYGPHQALARRNVG